MQAKAPRIELANEFLEIFMLGARGPHYPCISRRPRDVGARLGNNFLRGLLHLRIVPSFYSPRETVVSWKIRGKEFDSKFATKRARSISNERDNEAEL